MNLKDALRQKILKFLKIGDNYQKFYSINKNLNLSEYKTWYIGNSDELLNFYTNKQTNSSNGYLGSIYYRNKPNYFWAIASFEESFKRVHSGIPKVIIDTLSDVVGVPKIKVKEEYQEILNEILYENDFSYILSKEQRPMTMVEGWGAYKINMIKRISDNPILEFYDAEKVEFVYDSKKLVGVVFKDEYFYKNKKYLLLEIRKIEEGNSVIEFELYKECDDFNLTRVNFDEVPFLNEKINKKIVLKGLNRVFAVPCKYIFDPLNPDYGLSFYEGKIDLFDDLDQSLSQCSQTVRVSTPVEYYNPEVIGRGRNGEIKMPKVFNRQFIQKIGIPDGDGNINNDVQTTQPQLNFDQYDNESKHLLLMILTGNLSPATLGIDIAKKDNAEAQREKEKITIQTRNKIIERETRFIKELIEDLLYAKNYMNKGFFKLEDFEIGIKYNEFANPSFESQVQILGQALSNDAISIEKYVDLLWGDSLSEEEKQKEIEYIYKQKGKETLNVEALEKDEL